MGIYLDESITDLSFDFNNLVTSSTKNSNVEAVSAMAKSKNGLSFSFTAYKTMEGLIRPMIIVSYPGKMIKYIDLEGNNLLSIGNNNGNLSFANEALSPGTTMKNAKTGVDDGVGQCTARCIQDAYSNHGWVSVWAFVQTAFIPATAAAIAAACAAGCA